MIDRAEAHTHAQERPRVLGVGMDAHRLLVAHHNGRRGHRRDERTDRFHVERVALDDELRAVAVHLIFGVLEEGVTNARLPRASGRRADFQRDGPPLEIAHTAR